MLGTSEYADNLFLRLSSYSQRKDRDPLEDFCSEALVWCLRQSVTFRQGFFKLSQLDFLRRNADAIAIHSQQRFEEEGDDNATERNDIRGRFDVVFETPDSSLFVALESKVGAGFGSNQINKYLLRLESLKKSNPEVQCALITLTNLREGPVENARNVRHLFWGDVHNELEVASRAKPNASTGESSVLEILRQFAEFLKLKGLAYMNIPTVSPESLKQLIDASQLRKSMEDILESLKTSKHLKPFLARKRIRFDEEKSEASAYLGIYGSWKPFVFQIAFKLHETAPPKMSLYIERSLVGNRTDVRLPSSLKKNLRGRDFDGRQTWFHFEQPVDKQLNGDAEAMKRWFHQTSKLVLDMGEK